MVDNTIALQVRPFQTPDIGQIYGNIQNIQMNRMRMAEAQEMAQERNALRGLAASGLDPYSPEGLAQLRRVAPTLAPQYAQAASQQAYQRAQIDRIRSQNDREAFQTAQTLLVGVRNADDYARLRPALVERFPQYAEFFRPEYSPELIQRLAIGAEGLIRRESEAAAAARPDEYTRAVIAGGARPGTPEFEAAMRQRAEYLRGVRPTPPRGPTVVAPGSSVIDETGRVLFTAPDRTQDPARDRRIADTMATFGVDRPTAVGLVDNIIQVVQGSAGEPPVLINKLTNELITPRMGAARLEGPAIDLRRPQAAVPTAPTNMMLPGATGAPAPASVEDLYAGRRQRQVQQAGQTAEAEARGRVAAPPAPRQDYRYTPDFERVEPIPGSSAEREAADRERAERVRRETSQQMGGTVIRAIDDIEKTMRTAVLPTTGFFAERLSNVGGTAARNIRADIETIRSNVGIDQLTQMRLASPTGAALGNVTDRENAILQSVLGNLDQSQTEDQFLRNLRRLRDTFTEIIHYGIGNRPPVQIPGPGGRGTAEPPPREGVPDARRPAAGAAPAVPGEIRLPSGVVIRPIQ